ncbi:phage tail tube protein [Sphingobium ummariense]|uniref:Phage tail protein n=1 Tax=Sphingobium ummariense RL-3 TaxID=1346791 RepID=T0J1X3_9SPHN|nr:phage tail tube protein [Sphingobium ummariense]EQB31966.1 hypothetical protein M529_11935 [Sphingobium ummariense RL-3]
MANKNQVIGRARVKVNGQLIETAGDTTFDPGGLTREPVAGDYEAAAYRVSEIRPARLEINLLTKAGFSALAWGAMEDETVSVEFDNGQSWVMRNAYAERTPQITTSDGRAQAIAYSKPAEQVR